MLAVGEVIKKCLHADLVLHVKSKNLLSKSQRGTGLGSKERTCPHCERKKTEYKNGCYYFINPAQIVAFLINALKINFVILSRCT